MLSLERCQLFWTWNRNRHERRSAVTGKRTGARVASDRDIASWMRRQLDRHDWSAADLARRTGISPSRISDWLRGKQTPSSASCLRLADAFNADADYVLALAGHRVSETPVPKEDPRAGLIAMIKRVRMTPDRLASLEASLQAWLELDRSVRAAEARNGR